MSNMSYCRFRNTLHDLQDCLDNIVPNMPPDEDDGCQEELSPEEAEARTQLIELCGQIIDAAGEEVSLYISDEEV